LCVRLSSAIERGVDVTLLLESEQASAGQLSFDAAKAFKDVCLDKVRLLHWPIENRDRNQAGKPGKLHVKCAVIDETAIIGSANLTDDAFNRNMELGVIIKDLASVASICEHFETLERNGILKRV
jgi:phosphatidylserine/phosphatidylglycerophosphate/cardiolipin synthase-like enzyme